MNHNDALRLDACSRYLAGKLDSDEAEEFEKHYFECEQCAMDLRAEEVFRANLKAMFAEEPQAAVAAVYQSPRIGWGHEFWNRWALPLASAACVLLAIVVYRESVTIRGLQAEVADLHQPQSVSMVALKLARGAAAQPVPPSRYWVPYFFLPDSSEYSTYICDIQNSAGVKIRSVSLPKPPAGQPFSVFLSRAEFPSGTYVFHVHGQGSTASLATYTIDLPGE